MKLIHRIRASLLIWQAKALLRKAGQHQTSEQPAGVQIDGWVATCGAMLALIALIVCNFSPEPVSCDRPAQVHQK
jgi:hypothetical protein